MKPRRVFVQLELHTAEPLADLRNANYWSQAFWGLFNADELNACKQAQANVVKPEKAKRRAKGR